MAMTTFGLSARAYDRILKVGRTIAHMAGSRDIRPEHISEQFSTADSTEHRCNCRVGVIPGENFTPSVARSDAAW
jgi:hypothetical protein